MTCKASPAAGRTVGPAAVRLRDPARQGRDLGSVPGLRSRSCARSPWVFLSSAQTFDFGLSTCPFTLSLPRKQWEMAAPSEGLEKKLLPSGMFLTWRRYLAWETAVEKPPQRSARTRDASRSGTHSPEWKVPGALLFTPTFH